MPSYFFNDTATTEIYTFPSTTLFRSPSISVAHFERPAAMLACIAVNAEIVSVERSEEHTCELQSQSKPVCPLIFLMIRRPPRSTPFPPRRSSDLLLSPSPTSSGRPRCSHASPSTLKSSPWRDRKSTRVNSSHSQNPYALLFF